MSLSAEEERLLIDKAMEKHLAAILVLKKQRNCLAPISRLPPEIFCRIFAFVKLSYFSYRIHSPFSNFALAWIKITHVSTHWRYVAMNSPTLWADPPPQHGRWLAEMLKRSKMADLTIDTNFISNQYSKIAGLKEILRHHSARIQHLAMTNMIFECREILEGLPVSAPRLETLRLSASSWSEDKIWNDVCISKPFLSDSWKLRHLELSGFGFHLNCFPLSNVTHLKLHDVTKPARPTWTQFMDALARLFKLESLYLKSILDPTVKSTAGTSSGFVHLSLLRRLIVESPTTETEMFFRHVTFPPSATVHVRGIPQSHRSISEMSATISSIARLYSGQEFLTLSLRDAPNYPNFVQFKLFQEIVEDSINYYENTPVLTLEFVLSDGQVTTDQIIPEFFNNGLPLDKVSHADLATKVTNPDTLMYTIGNLPVLSFIRVKSHSGGQFVNALYPHSNVVDAEHFPLYFKCLTTIILHVMFKSLDRYTERKRFDINLDLLQDCLIQRYECGAEIQKLGLDDMHGIGESDVWELRNIVVDVDWDGIEQSAVYMEDDSDMSEEDSEESEDRWEDESLSVEDSWDDSEEDDEIPRF